MTPEQVAGADIDRIVAILLGRDTDQAEQKIVGALAAARPDRDLIRARLEQTLESGQAERFRGYSNDFFPEEYARGERAQAWHWLLRDYWDKPQAIGFALRQIASAHRTAARPSAQETLEEQALEAIAELCRRYKGDCDVAAALAGVSAHAYELWRLHDDWLYRFLGCAAIVKPLARRLAGKYVPDPVPPGGRGEPPEFPIAAEKLFKAIAPHLPLYPELWGLLERSALAHTGAFSREHVKPFADALHGDPRTQALLRAMCARLPTAANDAQHNAEILRVYMAHYQHLETDAGLLLRIGAEGRGAVACEAMHWLARFYHDQPGIAAFLLGRMRSAADSKVRVGAFYCLLLYFGDSADIAQQLVAQCQAETDPDAAGPMRNALAGKQTYWLYASFEGLERHAARQETDLFWRQVDAIGRIRTP